VLKRSKQMKKEDERNSVIIARKGEGDCWTGCVGGGWGGCWERGHAPIIFVKKKTDGGKTRKSDFKEEEDCRAQKNEPTH